MPRLRFADAVRLCSALIVTGVLACAQAAELGEPVVRSHMGQPLVADIELTALSDPRIQVAVRLSNADVYQGANIAMHPILANLNMSVMRRDGRQFLHITSVRPVDSENIHVFLDLTDGNRRNVRAVTLWLTPDPTPAPAPRPPVALPAPAPAPVPLPVPPPVAHKALVAAPEPAPRVERARPARVISVPSPAAVCPQAQFSEEQIKSCASMDYKNGLLSAQIVELEDKVKLLQLAIEGKVPAPAAAPKKAAPPPPAKPVPKPVAGFPWLLMIGIVVGLLVIGGAVWFMLSRRKGKTAETAAADSVAWYSRLAKPFRRKVKVETVVVEEVKDA